MTFVCILAELIMVIACMAHIHCAPYVMPELDLFEFVSLLSTSLLFFCGTLTLGEEDYQLLAQVLSLLIGFGYLLYAAVFGVKVARMFFKAEEKSMDEHQHNSAMTALVCYTIHTP